ncbi:MAG: hypothetical protein R3E12_14635 [Candidatus Eisenbacteria bacterium]
MTVTGANGGSAEGSRTGERGHERQFPGSGRRPHVAEVVVFAILLGWLAMAVSLVDIEYYDGFDSICNARYFLGWIDTYTATRGPLLGLLLVPAELIKGRMGLPPWRYDRPRARPAARRVSDRLLPHGAKVLQGAGPVLLAFVAAIPTFLFFGYAPFVSHDLFPGLVFLDASRRRPVRA